MWALELLAYQVLPVSLESNIYCTVAPYFFRENLFADCIRGCFVVACTLCAFISLVWLREQILMNGGPEWLEPNPNDAAPQAAPVSRIQRIMYSPDHKTYQ